MSDNIPASTKKLALKAELLRHLETASTMSVNNIPSSAFRAFTLALDIVALDKFDKEPDLEFWENVMNMKD